MSDYHYQIAILRGSENEAWDRANQLLYDVRCSLVLRTKGAYREEAQAALGRERGDGTKAWRDLGSLV